MTLQGIAQAFKRKLQINQEAVELVKQRLIEYLKKRGLPTDVELTPPRIKMALLPEGSKPVNNPLGTAPGVRLDVEGTVLFVLPGVPREAEAIFNETIAPLIKQAVGNRVFCERSLFVDGLFESVVAPLIDKIMGNNLGVYVKSHTKPSEGKPHLELHLTINVDIEQEPAKKLCKAAEELAVLIEKCGGQVQGQV
jgi:molybdopterin-biosynthesis enzyme MoeA-like protein